MSGETSTASVSSPVVTSITTDRQKKKRKSKEKESFVPPKKKQRLGSRKETQQPQSKGRNAPRSGTKAKPPPARVRKQVVARTDRGLSQRSSSSIHRKKGTGPNSVITWQAPPSHVLDESYVLSVTSLWDRSLSFPVSRLCFQNYIHRWRKINAIAHDTFLGLFPMLRSFVEERPGLDAPPSRLPVSIHTVYESMKSRFVRHMRRVEKGSVMETLLLQCGKTLQKYEGVKRNFTTGCGIEKRAAVLFHAISLASPSLVWATVHREVCAYKKGFEECVPPENHNVHHLRVFHNITLFWESVATFWIQQYDVKDATEEQEWTLEKIGKDLEGWNNVERSRKRDPPKSVRESVPNAKPPPAWASLKV
eukprot:CAMPEP_0113897432 /NCGR_PEP_ID=MMETSP0780_2-20120614/18674_1 /TAXON_ID=652834 /ORGANISM="Palpitomonas bilix" /LENGTH=363 /DNA_ID=CAMNT_0000888891 /DNA_START=413 /DNA_END=1504 /DNA_ORIENTATION=- /assembly_acc=CAM_ASM_000599